jgi:hypothetical protein
LDFYHLYKNFMIPNTLIYSRKFKDFVRYPIFCLFLFTYYSELVPHIAQYINRNFWPIVPQVVSHLSFQCHALRSPISVLFDQHILNIQYQFFIIFPVMYYTSNKELKANYEFQTLSVLLRINDVVNEPKIVAKLVCILKATITICAFKADIKCWYKFFS